MIVQAKLALTGAAFLLAAYCLVMVAISRERFWPVAAAVAGVGIAVCLAAGLWWVWAQ